MVQTFILSAKFVTRILNLEVTMLPELIYITFKINSLKRRYIILLDISSVNNWQQS